MRGTGQRFLGAFSWKAPRGSVLRGTLLWQRMTMSTSSPDSDDLIDLVARALDHLEREGHGALQGFLDEHPAESDAIRLRLQALAGSGFDVSPRGEGAVPQELGGYRLQEIVGGGGMGVVWRAWQVSLGREVALKLVRSDQLLLGGARQRFKREVEVIARLQHPGIVPVYEVGEERGIPFYSMELLRGASLADVISSLSGRDPSKLTGRDLFEVLPHEGDDPIQGTVRESALFNAPWHEVVLHIGREVAEALEYARRRGVIHRDVKPSNIMVTRGGRVLLLDFGLSTTSGDSRLTRSGSTVGTIAYMAPERLPGAPGCADPDDSRQDVYSLGATLFELLTLTLPYAREDELGLLRAALEGEVRALRSLNRAVPRDAVTLVQVAMERDPARRYESCGALARDLSNVLDHRALEARPPGPLTRARRWVQRNPLAAVLYGAAVLVPSLLFFQEVRNQADLEQKNIELRDAIEVATEERGRAEAALAKAMDAVDRMMVRVGSETLVDVPGMEQVRRDLLSDAVAFQEWFLGIAEDTPMLRSRTARVALSAAKVHGWLDELTAASEALSLAEELLGVDDDLSLAADIAATRAHIEGLLGNAEAASAATRRALDILREAPAGDRGSVVLRVNILADRAQSESRAGDLEGAHATLDEALAVCASLHAQDVDGSDPLDIDLLSAYARVALNLALVLDNREQLGSPGGLDLSERLFEVSRLAVDLSEALLELEPQSAGARQRAARAHTGYGLQLWRRNRFAESRSETERGIELLGSLTADYPGVSIYRADIATALSNLGGVLSEQGDGKGSEAAFLRSADEFAAYFSSGGSDPHVRAAFAALSFNLGQTYDFGGEMRKSLTWYDRCFESLNVLLLEYPDHPEGRLVEKAALENALPTYAQFGESVRLSQELRNMLRRARSEADRMAMFATLGKWPGLAAEAGGLTSGELEVFVNTIEDAALTLLEEMVETGTLSPHRIATSTAFEDLRALGRVRDFIRGK